MKKAITLLSMVFVSALTFSTASIANGQNGDYDHEGMSGMGGMGGMGSSSTSSSGLSDRSAEMGRDLREKSSLHYLATVDGADSGQPGETFGTTSGHKGYSQTSDRK